MVVSDGVGGAEVDGEDEIPALELERLIGLIEVEDLSAWGLENVGGDFHEGAIEGFELSVFELGVVGERPLATGVLVAPLVALAREVDPLGVAKFVPHEGEVSFPAGGEGEEAEDFVESDAAVDLGVVISLCHVVIHGGVHEPEGEGFVSDEGLVVALGVGDGFFSVAAVGEGVENFVEVPLLVGSVFEELDPVIWDSHGEAVVEAHAAFGKGAAEARHAAHVLGNAEGVGIDFVDELVGELEVGDGIPLDAIEEVFVVVIEGDVAMVVVEHGGDAIEAKAIEAEVLHPVGEVREEELADFFSAVVEKAGVPLGVVAEVKVEALLAIKGG